MGVVAILAGLVPMVLVTYVLLCALREHESGQRDAAGVMVGYALLLSIFAITEVAIIDSVMRAG